MKASWFNVTQRWKIRNSHRVYTRSSILPMNKTEVHQISPKVLSPPTSLAMASTIAGATSMRMPSPADKALISKEGADKEQLNEQESD